MAKAISILLIVIGFTCLIGCQAPNSIHPTGYKKTKISIEEYPFQVLHGESVLSTEKNARLERLDYVKLNDKLKLNNGHLILVHHSGKFAEFEGAVAVNIDSLQSTQVPNRLPSARLERRPDLSMILDGKKVTPPDSNRISIVGPYLQKYNGPVFCLNWYSDTSTEFKVLFKNFFSGTVVREKEVDGFSLSVDLSELVDSFDYGMVRLEIVDRANSQNFVGAMVLLNGTSQYDPDYCADVSAIQSLEIACHLVWSENWRSSDFFENAAELSDKPFYKEILKIRLSDD